jgi:hypothetical protein
VRYLEAEISSYQAERSANRPSDSQTETKPAKPPASGPVARSTQQNNILGLLEKLGELRSKGVVEEGEYRQKKDELLARL